MPRGINKDFFSNILSMSKAEVEEMPYEEKVHLLIDKSWPNKFSSAYILLCIKKNINFKEVNMAAKFASKGRVVVDPRVNAMCYDCQLWGPCEGQAAIRARVPYGPPLDLVCTVVS